MSRQLNAGEWEMPGVTMRKMPGTSDWIAELRLGSMFFVELSPEGGYPGRIVKELEEKGFVRVSDKVGVPKQETKEAHVNE